MRRKTSDVLAGIGGLVLAVVLRRGRRAAAVGTQLRQQPGRTASYRPEDRLPGPGQRRVQGPAGRRPAAMGAYAGQLMTTGAQAKTYADHFIAVHLREIGGGKTYSQLSAAVTGRSPTTPRWPARSRPSSAATPCAHAAGRVRLLADGPDRPDRRHRLLHRRRPAADPVDRRPRARAPGVPAETEVFTADRASPPRRPSDRSHPGRAPALPQAGTSDLSMHVEQLILASDQRAGGHRQERYPPRHQRDEGPDGR